MRTVRAALPSSGPSIVVLDELPWLLERDAGLGGTLQKLWDRNFESAPVLMVLIGSDLSVMDMLTDHDRPLYGRAKEMVVNPLTTGQRILDAEFPSDLQASTGLRAVGSGNGHSERSAIRLGSLLLR